MNVRLTCKRDFMLEMGCARISPNNTMLECFALLVKQLNVLFTFKNWILQANSSCFLRPYDKNTEAKWHGNYATKYSNDSKSSPGKASHPSLIVDFLVVRLHHGVPRTKSIPFQIQISISIFYKITTVDLGLQVEDEENCKVHHHWSQHIIG